MCDHMASRVTEAEARRRFVRLRKVRFVKSESLWVISKAVAEMEAIGYADLQRVTFSALQTSDGKTLSNSAYYHILVAAKLLNLVAQEEAGSPYTPTPTAHRILDVDVEDQGGLRRHLGSIARQSAALAEGYFWLYTGLQQRNLEDGKPVYITPRNRGPESRSTGRRLYGHRVESAFAPDLELSSIETQSLIFGVRRWCIEWGILDELVIPFRNDDPSGGVQVSFTLSESATDDWKATFGTLLLQIASSIGTRTANYWAISVPELLFQLCPIVHRPVEQVNEAVSDWLRANRHNAFPVVLSPSVAMSAWQRRAGDYEQMLRAYLKLPEGYVSQIGIFDMSTA